VAKPTDIEFADRVVGKRKTWVAGMRAERGAEPYGRRLGRPARNIVTGGIAVGAVVGVLLAIGDSAGVGPLHVAAVLAVVFVVGAWWCAGRLPTMLAAAVPVNETTFQELACIVRGVAASVDLPVPRLYVSPSPAPNAFATGVGVSGAQLTITAGLLRVLEPDELRGVVAHEMSHIRNRDTITACVATILVGMSELVAHAALGRRELGGGLDTRLLSRSKARDAITLPASAIARWLLPPDREYAADAAAARLLGTGEPLARALEKLDRSAHDAGAADPEWIAPPLATSCIVDPRGATTCTELRRSHPSTAERVARLRSSRS
jgi:heat shock protein HtpX